MDFEIWVCNNNNRVLKVWINGNNKNNKQILKFGLVIIIIGFWKFGLMIVTIIISRFWNLG